MSQASPEEGPRARGSEASGRVRSPGLDARLAVAIVTTALVAIVAIGVWKPQLSPSPSVAPSIPVAAGTPEPSRPAPASVEPSASVGPLATPEPQLVWAEIGTDPSAFEGGVVELLVAGPDELLAFGRLTKSLDPVEWMSTDGAAWSRVEIPASTFGGGVPTRVVFAGGTVIALGWRTTSDGTSREIWTSVDAGNTWSRDPWPSGRIAVDDPWSVDLAARGNVTLLAGDLDGRALLKRSTDGVRFVDLSEGDYGGHGALAVLPSSDGFVAIRTTPEGQPGSTIWHSADGLSWNLAEPAPVGGDVAATTFGADVLLVGTNPENGGLSYWSSRGAADELAPDVGGQEGLVALDGAVVSISNSGDPGAPAIVRISSDLQRWVEEDPSIGVVDDWAHLAVAYHGDLVAIGHGTDGQYHVLRAEVVQALPPTTAASQSPIAQASTSPSAVPVTPGGPRPTTSPFDGLEWQRLDALPAFGHGGARFVRLLGDRTIAIGPDETGQRAWTSLDGLHWSGPATIDPSDPQINGAAVGEGILVAVGARPFGTTTWPEAWVTDDGTRWRAVVLPGGPGWVASVTAGTGKFVAVGSTDDTPLIWTSTDGLTWSEAPFASRPDLQGHGGLLSVANGATGFVALESTQAGLVAFSSRDGRSWDPTGTPIQSGGVAWFGGLASLGDRFVSLLTPDSSDGSGNAGVPSIIAGPSTGSWASGATFPTPGFASQDTLEAVDGGLAVVGADGSDPAIWLSADGSDWLPIDPGDLAGTGIDPHEQASISDIASDGGGLIAVGTVGGLPTIWLARPQAELVPDRVCPRAIATMTTLLSLSPAEQAACLGTRPITLRAWATVNDCFGQAGLAVLQGTLSAVESPCGLNLFSSTSAIDGLGPDTGTLTLPRIGSGHWVLATLRFGQAADAPCRPHADPAAVQAGVVNGFEPLTQDRFACLEVPHLVSLILTR